jgi:hypothetical protein
MKITTSNGCAARCRRSRIASRLGVAAFLAALAILLNSGPAQASWWHKSVSKMDVRGITLGMTLDEVAKLHPELQPMPISAGGVVGGKFVPLDPSLVEHRLTQSAPSDTTQYFFVDFASPKLGGGAYNLYLMQTAPSGANIADLLADMEKKFGSPTDLRLSNDTPDDSNSITASWGMGIDACAPEADPQSGEVLKIELENQGGNVQVSIFLTDFRVGAADAQAKKDYLAHVARQQTDQANKALSY